LVGHHRRYNPLVREARSIVQSGALGRLVAVSVMWALLKPPDYYEVEWRCRRPDGGPTLINLIHELDSLRFICGEVSQVYVQASRAVRSLEVEDSLSVALSFANGALATAIASDATPSPWSYEAATGENPHYFHAEENCYYFLGSLASLAFPRMEMWRYPKEGPSGWQYPLERFRCKVTKSDPLVAQLKHFCRVVRGEEAPLVDAEEGRRSLAVALAVLESAERQGPVTLGPRE
jgi:predicted dehydrogenase